MTTEETLPCLHCLLGRVIRDYMIEHDISDVQFVADALAEVMGDMLGGSSNEPDVWSDMLTAFNMAALRRAQTLRTHRN